MIEIRGLHKRFGDNVVFDGVDLDVRTGETLALLGPSGVGKTVLLKSIIGLIKPDQGTIVVDGLNIRELGRKALTALRMRMGYVFQYGALSGLHSRSLHRHSATPPFSKEIPPQVTTR